MIIKGDFERFLIFDFHLKDWRKGLFYHILVLTVQVTAGKVAPEIAMKIFTNDAMVYQNHYNVTHLVLPMMTPSGLSIGTILKTKRSLRALATWELPVNRLYKMIYTGKNVFHNHEKARSLWCGQVMIAIIMITTREELDGSSHIVKELIHIIYIYLYGVL